MKNTLLLLFVTLIIRVSYGSSLLKIEEVSNTSFIENTKDQIEYLIKENSNKKQDEKWYIYLVGQPVDTLKYYIDKTTKEHFSTSYLKNLNDDLIKINALNNVAVYVAFTDYENKILTPILPEDVNTLNEAEIYINSLINTKSKDYTPNELVESKKHFNTFSKEFQDLIKQVFTEDLISKMGKPNIVLPFSSYSIRQVIQLNTVEYIEKEFFTYTFYTPKLDEAIDKEALKNIYVTTAPNVGLSEEEQIISRSIASIYRYFTEDITDYLRCRDLLVKYQNEAILNDFPEFATRPEANPCILNYVVPWGEDKEKSEWMSITEDLINIPLYAVMAIPLTSVAGVATVEELSRKQIEKACKAAAIEVFSQTLVNYWFEESVYSEIDSKMRWEKALLAVNKPEVFKETLKQFTEISTRNEVVFACLNKGVAYKNVDWENLDFEKASISFSLKDCGNNVLNYVFFEKIGGDAASYALKKMLTLIKSNPRTFVKVWRELLEDIGPDFRSAARVHTTDILKAINLKADIDVAVEKYIKSSFHVEDALDDAIKAYVKEVNGTANNLFENAIKDAAIETDLAIYEAHGVMMNGVGRKILKQGANVSLNFKVSGREVKIYATLLERLDDDSYRIVFVNQPSSGYGTVAEFINNTTKNRNVVLKALIDGEISFYPTAKGVNAGKLEIDGKEIEIAEIELRTQRSDGAFKKETIVSKRISNDVDGIYANIKKNLENPIDEAQWQKFKKDFHDVDELSRFAQEPGLVDSWRYIGELKPSGTSKLTQDVDFLQVVYRQRGNPDLINKIGSDKYDDIIKNYSGQCKGCDAPASSASEAVKHLPPHDEMLESLEAFTTKHHGKDGFDKVINYLKSTDPRKQKGAEFVTNALKRQDGVTAFEFKYLGDLDNTADFVLNGKNIDGKSWSVASSIDNIGNWNLSGQLKDYFKSDQVFEQWFDYSRFQKSANETYSSMSKTDAVEHIKKQYQKLFEKERNAQELFDYITDNGENIDKFEAIFGENISNVDDFIDDVISDLSNSDLYGFIKVK